MIPFELAPDEVERLVPKLHGIAMTLASERVTRQRLHHRGGDLGWVMVVLVTSALVLLVQIMRDMRIISECGSMA